MGSAIVCYQSTCTWLVLDWKSTWCTWCLPSTLSTWTCTCTCKNEKVLVLDSSTSKSTWPQPWSAQSHYLNQCWNVANWTLRDKFLWNLNRNLYIFGQENTSENVGEMAAILSRPQCVKHHQVADSWAMSNWSNLWTKKFMQSQTDHWCLIHATLPLAQWWSYHLINVSHGVQFQFYLAQVNHQLTRPSGLRCSRNWRRSFKRRFLEQKLKHTNFEQKMILLQKTPSHTNT